MVWWHNFVQNYLIYNEEESDTYPAKELLKKKSCSFRKQPVLGFYVFALTLLRRFNKVPTEKCRVCEFIEAWKIKKHITVIWHDDLIVHYKNRYGVELIAIRRHSKEPTNEEWRHVHYYFRDRLPDKRLGVLFGAHWQGIVEDKK